MVTNISKHYTRFNFYDSSVAKGIIEREETPAAIQFFSEKCEKLTDYSYWFLLSTCWVSYTGWSDLNLWKELFSSDRPKRKHSIMKPNEVSAFDRLPYFVTVYRAHRIGETDWIAYTLDENIVKRFAKERGVTSYSKYKVKKQDILALFLRRGEQEVIILDKEKVEFIEEIPL